MPNIIETKLDELKTELAEIETDIGKKSKDRDTLKADINDLQRIVNEVNQIANAYGKAYENNNKNKNDMDSYAATKKAMIEAALPEADRTNIDDKEDEVEDAITAKETSVNNLETTFETAKTEYETAKKELENKQKVYESLKTYQKELEDKLKNLKGLKDWIEKEEEANHLFNMYFLIKEINSDINFTIKTQDELKTALYTAWEEWDTAKEDFREKDEKMKADKNNLEKEQKILESMKKTRRTDILEKIKELQP